MQFHPTMKMMRKMKILIIMKKVNYVGTVVIHLMNIHSVYL